MILDRNILFSNFIDPKLLSGHIRGKVAEVTVVLRCWRIFLDNLALSTELMMKIGHRKVFLKVTFLTFALRLGE